MPFKEGFNFRSTAAFVTDPTDTQYADFQNTVYPTTANGVTFGFEGTVSGGGHVNRSTGVDARLAGVNLTTSSTFRVDLPAAGDYAITLALGDQAAARSNLTITFKDTNTTLFTVSGSTPTTQDFIDAQGTIHGSAAVWVSSNATRTSTFSTTIFRAAMGDATNSTYIAHISLEQTSSPNGTGNASIGTVAATAPAVTGTGAATASASLPTVTVSALAASASVSVTASAGIGTATATAASATATGTASAGAALPTVTATAPEASAGVSVTASAALATVSAASPAASATGGATASPAIGTVTASAPATTATGDAVASAGIATATATAPASTATGTATTSAALATVTASAPAATGTGDATTSATIGTVTATALEAAATGAGAGTGSAIIGTVTVTAPQAAATADAAASAGLATVTASAPTATASAAGNGVAAAELATILCEAPRVIASAPGEEMTKQEQAMRAMLERLTAAFPGVPVDRDVTDLAKATRSGAVRLSDGDARVVDRLIGTRWYEFETGASATIAVQDKAVLTRKTQLDELREILCQTIEADPTLGGIVDYAEITDLSPGQEDVDGGWTLSTVSIDLVLHYGSNSQAG